MFKLKTNFMDMDTEMKNRTETVDFNQYGIAFLVPEWSKDAVTIFLFIVLFLGVPGNSLVTAVQFKTIRKTATDWFVLFMAICDMISLLFCVPIYIIISQGKWEYIGSSMLCKFYCYVTLLTFTSTTYLIVAVSLDRLFKTMGSNRFTSKKAFYTGIIINIMSASWNVQILFSAKVNKYGHCTYDFERYKIIKYLLGMSTILALLSCVLLLIIYIKIVIEVRKSSKVGIIQINTISNSLNTEQTSVEHAQNKKNRQRNILTTRVMALVTILFVFSTIIPSISGLVLGLNYDLKQSVNGRTLLFMLTKLYVLNNCANPLFYVWLYPSFRNKVISLLSRSS